MGHREAKIPRDEETRLRTLLDYNILDTTREPGFDEIVQLAATICNVPISLISLVEHHRQWFKASVGVDVSETPRSVSFCAHAILDDAPLVVSDATLDSRFSENPLVQDNPNIRFYAGVPLISPNGCRIGTLCVIDRKPRTLSSQELTLLRVLARQVISQLEIRSHIERNKSLIEQTDDQRKLLSVIDTAVSIVELSTDGTIVSANETFLSLMGYAAEELIGKNHCYLVPFSERREAEYQDFWRRLREGQRFSGEFRRITKDHREVWIKSEYVPVCDLSGTVTRIIKTAIDVTSNRESIIASSQLWRGLDTSTLLMELTPEGTVTYMNTRFTSILGRSLSELVGKSSVSILPSSDRDSSNFTELWEHVRAGHAIGGNFEFHGADNRLIATKGSYFPVFDRTGKISKVVYLGFDTSLERLQGDNQAQLVAALSKSGATIEFDLHGKILEANSNFLNLMRYGREEVIGKNHSIFVGDDELESQEYQAFWESLRSGKFRLGEFRRFNKYGQEVWIRGAYNPVVDDHQNVTKVVMFTFDVTASKEAEARLSNTNKELVRLNEQIVSSEARFRALTEASPLGIFCTDVNGNCIYVNDRYASITGQSWDQAVGRGWLNTIHPYDRDRVEQDWADAAEAKTEYRSTHRFLRSDGSTVWCQVRASVLRENGKYTGHVATVEDVTTQKLSEQRLKVATKAARVGFWELDLVDNSLSWDASMRSMYGLKDVDAPMDYATWLNAICPDDRAEARSLFELGMAEKREFESVFKVTRADGALRYMKVSGIVERGEDGAARRMVGVNLDVAELKEAQLAAESAAVSKSRFLANMSHEIRTPLTSIIGFAEAAREDGVCPDDRLGALSTIYRNGKHLLDLINDILDVSKIDAGALSLEAARISPVELVEQARAIMVPRLAEKGLSLIVNYEWMLPEWITGDSFRLTQVLLNLLNNAIKFTESGIVEITVRCDSDLQRMYFTVKDSGIGMSQEQVGKLFQPFMQADRSTTRRYGGTGLGLAISKQLVEKMGGVLSASSELHQGSEFSFFIETGPLDTTEFIDHIPQASLHSSPSTESRLQSLQGRVLVADDQADNRRLLEFSLRKSGLALTFVENGQQALDAAMKEQFDVILLDVQMPEMDGHAVTRSLRTQGLTLPIVAFTAGTMKQDVLKCIESGYTTHLAKPFSKESLIDCLDRQLAASRRLKHSV